jgi:TonB family protein
MHTGESLAGAFGLGADERRTRLLGRALLASLALHALILLCLSVFRDSMQGRVEPPPLTARLAKPKPPPEPPRMEPTPQLAAPRPVALAPRPSPTPLAPATPVLSAEPAQQTVESVPVVPAAAPQPVAPPQATARVESPPATGPDPGSVARFRLELMDIARRYKRYPRIAQDNNWEGRVELRIVFAENGAMTALTVRKSAGRAVLDDEAQAMIRSAQPQVTLPSALRGKAFVLEIPVEFSLRDAR